LGSIVINDDGGFTNWKPGDLNINTRETWILLLTPAETVGTESAPGEKFEIMLYPNPARQVVNLQWVEDSSHKTLIQMIDLTGQILQEQVHFGTIAELNLEAYPPGPYFIKVSSNGKSIVLRLIVVE